MNTHYTQELFISLKYTMTCHCIMFYGYSRNGMNACALCAHVQSSPGEMTGHDLFSPSVEDESEGALWLLICGDYRLSGSRYHIPNARTPACLHLSSVCFRACSVTEVRSWLWKSFPSGSLPVFQGVPPSTARPVVCLFKPPSETAFIVNLHIMTT